MSNSPLGRSGMARVNERSHNFTSHPHVYPQVEWTIPAFTPQPQSVTALWTVLIFRPAEGRRLSWPEWLVTNRGGLLARRRSPTQYSPGPAYSNFVDRDHRATTKPSRHSRSRTASAVLNCLAFSPFLIFCVTVPCGRCSFPPINFVVHVKRIILLLCTVNNIIHRIKTVVTKTQESFVVLKPITNTVTLTRDALDILKIWDWLHSWVWQLKISTKSVARSHTLIGQHSGLNIKARMASLVASTTLHQSRQDPETENSPILGLKIQLRDCYNTGCRAFMRSETTDDLVDVHAVNT